MAGLKSRFMSGRNELATCRCCGKRTHSSIGGASSICLCRQCYEDAGDENTHLDCHSQAHPDPSCRWCVAEGWIN